MSDRLVLDVGGVVCEVNLPQPSWYAALATTVPLWPLGLIGAIGLAGAGLWLRRRK